MADALEHGEPAEVLKKTEYADRVGLHRSRITQLTKPGQKLHSALTPNGKIDVPRADRLLKQTYDPSNVMAKPPPVDGRGNGAAPLAFGDDEEDDDSTALADAKARKAEADAALKELELAERRGDLVAAKTVRLEMQARLKALFDQLRGLKRGLAERLIHDKLLAPEMQSDAVAAIGAEIDKAIGEFRDTLAGDRDNA